MAEGTWELFRGRSICQTLVEVLKTGSYYDAAAAAGFVDSGNEAVECGVY